MPSFVPPVTNDVQILLTGDTLGVLILLPLRGWVLFHQCLMVPCCSALDEVDMDDAVHFTANARKWPQVFQLLLHPPKWKGKLNPICSMCLNHFCMFLLASATPVSPLLPCCTSSLCWVTNKQKNYILFWLLICPSSVPFFTLYKFFFFGFVNSVFLFLFFYSIWDN